MAGTNDSNPIGLNLSAVEFSNKVASVASAIDDTIGRQMWAAKPMPTYEEADPPSVLDATRNANIELYNAEIDLIVSAHAGTAIGPDFYTNFNDVGLYDDYLHPNDTGYQVMAEF